MSKQQSVQGNGAELQLSAELARFLFGARSALSFLLLFSPSFCNARCENALPLSRPTALRGNSRFSARACTLALAACNPRASNEMKEAHDQYNQNFFVPAQSHPQLQSRPARVHARASVLNPSSSAESFACSWSKVNLSSSK